MKGNKNGLKNPHVCFKQILCLMKNYRLERKYLDHQILY